MATIKEIAVRRTMDPLQTIMDCLFEKKGDVFISNKILGIIKQNHSYTMITRGSNQVYTFHRRARGTDTIFSFLVTTVGNQNKVSNFEYTTELGVRKRNIDLPDGVYETKLYVMLLGE